MSSFSDDSASRLNFDTRTQETVTDSRILHPDDTPILTSSYGQAQMSAVPYQSSSVEPSIASYSQASSRRDSISSEASSSYFMRRKRQRAGALSFTADLGLARVLNERQIGGKFGGSTVSLDQMSQSALSWGDDDEMSLSDGTFNDLSRVVSLTPSIINTPACEKHFSPTGTPLNSPARTPPGKLMSLTLLLYLNGFFGTSNTRYPSIGECTAASERPCPWVLCELTICAIRRATKRGATAAETTTAAAAQT